MEWWWEEAPAWITGKLLVVAGGDRIDQLMATRDQQKKLWWQWLPDDGMLVV